MSESAPLIPETPAPTNGDVQPVDPAIQPAPEQDYDKLVDPTSDLSDLTVEGAAVHDTPVAPTAAQEAERQAGIAAADRQTREDAGLPPRVHDLT